jgi:antitoxin MazE
MWIRSQGEATKTQVARWGTSLAIRIPKPLAEAATLRQGDQLEMAVEGSGAITMRKPKRRRKAALQDLLRAITPENIHEGTDWGEPKGRETW